jgi:hypothetical protein
MPAKKLPRDRKSTYITVRLTPSEKKRLEAIVLTRTAFQSAALWLRDIGLTHADRISEGP